jgi:hypothetical protein
MGASISKLNQGTPTSASQIPFYDSANGRDAKCSVGDIAAVVQPLLATPDDKVTQYFAPNATGWSVIVAPPDDGVSMYLQITPSAGYAAGTVTLPPQASCIDKQEVLVTCTQLVTALTVAGNGSVVNNAPTAITAAVPFFRLRFDGVAKAWYRVG